ARPGELAGGGTIIHFGHHHLSDLVFDALDHLAAAWVLDLANLSANLEAVAYVDASPLAHVDDDGIPGSVRHQTVDGDHARRQARRLCIELFAHVIDGRVHRFAQDRRAKIATAHIEPRAAAGAAARPCPEERSPPAHGLALTGARCQDFRSFGVDHARRDRNLGLGFALLKTSDADLPAESAERARAHTGFL